MVQLFYALVVHIALRIRQGFGLHRKVGYEHLNKHLIVFSTFAFFKTWVDGI